MALSDIKADSEPAGDEAVESESIDGKDESDDDGERVDTSDESDACGECSEGVFLMASRSLKATAPRT